MTEAQFQVTRLAGFLLALGFATLLQRVAPHTRLRGSWRTNGALWAINAVVMGLVCGACACSTARWAAARGLGVLNAAPLPARIGVPITVVVLDLVSYGWHRANHRVPLLWRFHRVHHSDRSFTVSTGVRFHPGELLLSLPLRLAAVVVLGAPVVGVATFEVLFNVANLAEHGNIKLPRRAEQRLAFVCVTPALHRRHHSRRLAELDTNFGTIFTLWDRLLGSFGPSSSSVTVRTGLPDIEQPVGLARALVLPLGR